MRARAWIGIVAVASLPIAGGSGAPATAQSCPQLSGVCSATIVGDTSSASNANSGSCGGSGAPEALFFYSAPRAGTYTIDSIGSSFDTVLYVRDDGAGGAGAIAVDKFLITTGQVGPGNQVMLAPF
jgi:hypothetical protein